MKLAKATLKSISPYSQSRPLQSEKNKGEGDRDFERRIWRERCHSNKAGDVFIPPMAFKNCLSEAAKYLSIKIPGEGKATYTKHFEAGLLVVDPLMLPLKRDDIDSEWLFVPSDGRRGGPKRVHRCFPVIHEWRGEIEIHVLDEKVLQTHASKDSSVLEYVLREAGSMIGVGRFRPRNNGFYGRFIVEKFELTGE